LETVPKPRYNGFARQADFIETYFEAAVDNGVASPAAVNAAKELALRYGLSGLDALHIQTSLEFGAAEFVTGEIKEVLTRVREIKVIQLGGRPKP
jgi:predicted nucleic acid-binding protein